LTIAIIVDAIAHLNNCPADLVDAFNVETIGGTSKRSHLTEVQVTSIAGVAQLKEVFVYESIAVVILPVTEFLDCGESLVHLPITVIIKVIADLLNIIR
jgi:hypothetical protein